MDPIALLNSALATMAGVVLFLLPGIALGPLVLPGASTPLARLGRAAGVSLLAGLIGCTVLARLGLLTAPAVVALFLLASALGFAVRRPRWRLPALRGRGRGWWVAAAAGTALALGLIVIPSHLGVRPDLLPRSSTTWYYLHLADLTARLGAFPATVQEWAAARPFPTDYLPVTAHTAAALLLLPGDPVVRLEMYRLVILGLAVVFAILLFRRWVSAWTAVAGAILLLATVRLDQKFDGYRPETVALVAALFALWLTDRACVERDRRLAAVAIVGVGLVFLSHAEVFLVLAPAIVGIATARLVVAPGGRPGAVGLRSPGRAQLGGFALAIGVVAGGAVVGALGGLALTGESRAIGYVLGGDAGPTETTARGRPGEIPAGWTFTDDPTWDFYIASVAPALNGSQPPDAFTDSQLLPRSVLLVWPGLDGRLRSGLAVLAALLVAPALAWAFLDARRRRMLLTWAVFGAVLIAGSILLFALSDSYVPQRTAGRRLIPYLLFLPVVAMTAILWLAGRLAAPFWRAVLPGRGRAALAAGVALAVLTAGAVSASPRPGAVAEEREASLSPVGYEAYRWMGGNLSADARILANAYTDGAIAAVTGRVGLLDGRAVYLENPAFLAESTALCLGARVVFGTPAAPGAGTYLARERPTHLLVATEGPQGRDLGGYVLFDTDVPAIRADSRFRLIRSFGGERLLLFEVRASITTAAAAAGHDR